MKDLKSEKEGLEESHKKLTNQLNALQTPGIQRRPTRQIGEDRDNDNNKDNNNNNIDNRGGGRFVAETTPSTGFQRERSIPINMDDTDGLTGLSTGLSSGVNLNISGISGISGLSALSANTRFNRQRSNSDGDLNEIRAIKRLLNMHGIDTTDDPDHNNDDGVGNINISPSPGDLRRHMRQQRTTSSLRLLDVAAGGGGGDGDTTVRIGIGGIGGISTGRGRLDSDTSNTSGPPPGAAANKSGFNLIDDIRFYDYNEYNKDIPSSVAEDEDEEAISAENENVKLIENVKTEMNEKLENIHGDIKENYTKTEILIKNEIKNEMMNNLMTRFFSEMNSSKNDIINGITQSFGKHVENLKNDLVNKTKSEEEILIEQLKVCGMFFFVYCILFRARINVVIVFFLFFVLFFVFFFQCFLCFLLLLLLWLVLFANTNKKQKNQRVK